MYLRDGSAQTTFVISSWKQIDLDNFALNSHLREEARNDRFVCLLVGCLTSQQHASVSQGRICSDNCTCCHTEIEVADLTFHLTQSQYTDTGPTSPSTDPITPVECQFVSHTYDSTRGNPGASEIRPRRTSEHRD